MGERAETAPEIRILQVPDCPLVDRLQTVVAEECDELGIQPAVTLDVGDYPSPTLLVGGVDVMTGQPVEGVAQCRLDLPPRDRIVSELQHLRHREQHEDTVPVDEDKPG